MENKDSFAATLMLLGFSWLGWIVFWSAYDITSSIHLAQINQNQISQIQGEN